MSFFVQGQAGLQPIRKDSSSLSSEFCSCNTAYYMHVQASLAACTSPSETGTQGTSTNTDTQAAAIAVTEEPSFVSDSRYSWLLEAYRRLWQANLVACKEDTISDILQLLTMYLPDFISKT